ncbi:MAG: YceI family protein [Rhizobacter sp.]|nr:YceI family protein [Chlorobiales bacterium]
MKSTRKFFLLLWLTATANIATAQTPGWNLDTARTTVGFSIGAMFSKTDGKFTSFSGTLQTGSSSDSANFEDASVSVTIAVASIETGIGLRDEHLRGGDYFDAEKFPLIAFRSTRFKLTGEKTYSVRGYLTVKGITRETDLTATLIKRSDTHVIFKATGNLDRAAYRVGAGGIGLGREVELTFTAEFVKPNK